MPSAADSALLQLRYSFDSLILLFHINRIQLVNVRTK